jgi:hypothetical protein
MQSVPITTNVMSSNPAEVSSTNKTDHHDITEILLKVALNTIKQTNKHKTKVLLPHGYVTSADLAILLNPFGFHKWCISSEIQ